MKLALMPYLLRSYLRRWSRARANARDLERINENADALNAEAEDVQRYQFPTE